MMVAGVVLFLVLLIVSIKDDRQGVFLAILYLSEILIQAVVGDLEPLVAYAALIGIEIPFALYCWSVARNSSWIVLGSLSFIAAIINLVCMNLYLQMLDGTLSPDSFIKIHDNTAYVLLFTSLVQIVVLLRATNGLKGICRLYNSCVRWAALGDSDNKLRKGEKQ